MCVGYELEHADVLVSSVPESPVQVAVGVSGRIYMLSVTCYGYVMKNDDLLVVVLFLSREKRDIAITFVCLSVCLFVC